MAGKRQANALAATLQNTKMLAEAYQTAEDSAGSAMREQRNFEKGVQYSLERFKASTQSMLYDTIGPGPIKGAVDAGNSLIGVLDTILDKTGMLGPALAAGMAFFTRRTGKGFLTYDKSTNAFGGLFGAPLAAGNNARKEGGSFAGGITGYLQNRKIQRKNNRINSDIRSAFASEVVNIDSATLWQKSLFDESKYAKLDTIYSNVADKLKISEEELRRIVPAQNMVNKSGAEWAMYLENVNQQQRGFGDMLKGGLKSFGAMGGQMALMMAASWALEFAIEKISEKTVTFDEALEGTRALITNYKQARDETNENIKATDDLSKTYAKLKKGVQSGTNKNLTLSDESYQEYLDASNQMAQMFPSLIDHYDAEGNAVLNLSSDLHELAGAYDDARKSAAQSLINGDEEAGTDFNTFAQAYLNATSQTQATNTSAGALSRVQGGIEQFWHGLTGKYEAGIDTTYNDALKSMAHFFEDRNDLIDSYNEEAADLYNDKEVHEAIAAGTTTLGQSGYEYVQTFNDLEGFLDIGEKELREILKDDQKYEEARSKLITQFTQMKTEQEEMIAAGRDYLSVYTASDDLFYTLSDDQQNMLNALTGNMSREVIDALFAQGTKDGDISARFNTFTGQLMSNVQLNPQAVSSFNDVLQQIGDTSNITAADLEVMGGQIATIAESIDDVNTDQLSEMMGFKDLADGAKRVEEVGKKFGKTTKEYDKLVGNLKASQFDMFLDAANNANTAAEAVDNFKGSVVSAAIAAGDTQYTLQDALDEGGRYAAAQATQANDYIDKGDTRTSMAEMIKRAKELYDDHMTGTDEFKSIASMIDPFGSSDASRFKDNYDKVKNYLKDDTKKGVVAWLKDLSEVQNEAGEKMASFNKETGEWELVLDNLDVSASKLGQSPEFIMAMIDAVEALGGHMEVFETAEEGYARLSEIQEELTGKELELKLLEDSNVDGKNDDAIAVKKKEIEELKTSTKDARAELERLVASTPEERKQKKESYSSVFDEAGKTAEEIVSDKSLSTQGKQAQLYGLAEALQSGVNDYRINIDPKIDKKSEEALDKVQGILDANNVDFQIDYKSDIDDLTTEGGNDLVDLAEATINAGVANILAPTVEGLATKSEEALAGLNEEKQKKDKEQTQLKEEQSKYNPKGPTTWGEVISNFLNNPPKNRGKGKVTDPVTGREIGFAPAPTSETKPEGTEGHIGDFIEAVRRYINKPSDSHETRNIQEEQKQRFQEKYGSSNNNQMFGNLFNNNQKQTVDIDANTTEYDKKTKKVEKKGEELEEDDVEVHSTFEDGGLMSGLDTSMTKAEALDGFKAMVHALAQDNASPILQSIDQFLNGDLDGEEAEVGVEANDGATPILDAVRGAVQRFASSGSANITLGATDNATPVIESAKTEANSIEPETVTMEGDNSDVVSKANAAKDAVNAIPASKFVSIVASVTGMGVLQNLKTLISSIKSKTVTIKANKEGSVATGTIGGFATGTIGAFARGSKVAIGKSQTAVVNELGEEGLIRNGVLHRITGGMQQIHLKKGDIVVNAAQMSELEKGEVKSNGGRGKLIGSFANGSLNGIRSFASGGLDLGDSGGRKSKSNNTKSVKDNTKAVSKNTGQQKKNTKSAEDLKDAFDALHDWIERWIERENAIMDRLESRADSNTVGWRTQNKYLGQAINRAKSDVSKANDAYERYMKEARSVGLDSKYVKLIQQGKKDSIESISEDAHPIIREKIEQYQTWWDKAQSTLDQQIEWQQKITDLEQQRLDNIEDHYDTINDLYESRQDVNDARRSQLEANNKSIRGKSYQRTINLDIGIQRNITRQYTDEARKYQNEMKKARAIFGKNSDQYNEARTALNKINAARRESMAKEVEIAQDYAKERIEEIEKTYDLSRSKIETKLSNRESAQSRKEAAGLRTTSYKQNNKYENQLIKSYKSEQKALKKELNSGRLAKNSEEYKEKLQEQKKLTAEINKHQANIYENTVKMRDAQIDALEAIRSIRSAVVSKLDALVTLTQTHDNYVSDKTYREQVKQSRLDYKTLGKENTELASSWEQYLSKDGMWIKELKDSGFVAKNKNNQIYSTKNLTKILDAAKNGRVGEIETIFKKVYGNKQGAKAFKKLSQFTDEIQTYVNNQTEILNLKNTIEGYLDAAISSRTEYLNKVKDEIQKVREAAERALELQKASYELDKAMNNKTVRTWNGREWVYTSDIQAVKSAQENLDNINYQNTIKNIDQTVEKIEDYMRETANLYKDDGTLKKSDWEGLFNKYVSQTNKWVNATVKALKGSGYDLSKVEKYGTGGVVASTDKNDSTLIRVSAKERILTPEQNRMFEELIMKQMPQLVRPDAQLATSAISTKNSQINQVFNITLPNINDASSAETLMRDLQSIATKKLQYF